MYAQCSCRSVQGFLGVIVMRIVVDFVVYRKTVASSKRGLWCVFIERVKNKITNEETKLGYVLCGECEFAPAFYRNDIYAASFCYLL